MTTPLRDGLRSAVYLPPLGLALTALAFAAYSVGAEGIRGSPTYRPGVVGTMAVVATGRHFATEAGMRMLAGGGNAVDASVAATFAAAVSEISHFGLGGEVPIILYRADRNEVVVINGQGTAPATVSRDVFSETRSIPANGPSAGTIPAVVDALSIALTEFGTRSLAEALQPAIELADGFPWYESLTTYLKPELPKMALFPSRARAYPQGPGGTDENHPNVVQGGKRPRTTLSLTMVLRDGKPFLALSSPGGDSQDQQALQVFLNIAVFTMRPQEAIEGPRFNSLHHDESFGDHSFQPGVLEVEDRIPPGVVEALRRLGHKVEVQGPFMLNTGTALAGVDAEHGTVFGAADPRRQRFGAGW